MTAPLAVTFSQIVLAVHIAAVVVAFGVIFAYPIVFTVGRRMDARHLGWFHRVQGEIDKRLVGPGLLVIILAGIYLASHEDVWSAFYVGWGMTAAIVLGGLSGAFFIPRERRLAELAQRDIDAAGTGPVTLSDEYEALARQVFMVSALASLLVLLTILIMTIKP